MASLISWRTGGVPLLSLFGFGIILLNVWVAYNYIVNRIYVANAPISEELVVGVVVVGAAAYTAAK
ncbi:MAG: hypothetical protein QW514_09445, partial [Thermoprotei archaeon]